MLGDSAEKEISVDERYFILANWWHVFGYPELCTWKTKWQLSICTTADESADTSKKISIIEQLISCTLIALNFIRN